MTPANLTTRVCNRIAARWRSWVPSRRFLCERDAVALPPAELRAAGPLFRTDSAFRNFAITDIDLMERHTSVQGKSMLDFGCGVGRLYFGFRQRNAPGSYLGLDVRPDTIGWARRHITPANKAFRFACSDIGNERYNPKGTLRNENWTDVLSGAFDIIYCYSVLSHLTEVDARKVLRLFAAHIFPGGYIFLTAFVGEQADNVAINPPDLGIAIRGPLHVVRYRHDYFNGELLRDFRVIAEFPGAATDGQTIYVLQLSSPAV